MTKKIIISKGWAEALGEIPPEVGTWPIRPGLVALRPIIIDPDPLFLDEVGRALFRAGKFPLVALTLYDKGIPYLCYLPLAKPWLEFSLAHFAKWEEMKTYAEDIALNSLARQKFGGNREFVKTVAKAYGVHFGLVLHQVMVAVKKHQEEKEAVHERS